LTLIYPSPTLYNPSKCCIGNLVMDNEGLSEKAGLRLDRFYQRFLLCVNIDEKTAYAAPLGAEI